MSEKRYFIFVVLVTLGVVFSLVVVGTKAMFFDQLFGYQLLYEYQLSKLEVLEDGQTIFVGDSSLGNSIDASYFSQLSTSKTTNLALTGLYGYAGSFNMIKKVIGRVHINNIVVMHSLDQMQRDVSYKGYLLTVGDYSDFIDLKPTERSALITAFVDLTLSPDNLKAIFKSYFGHKRSNHVLQNDYVAQLPDGQFSGRKTRLNPGINKEKVLFLKKIIELAQSQNINLIYVHGPIMESIALDSKEYIAEVRHELSALNIRYLPKIMLISKREIGDKYDHVSPSSKLDYTQKYYELVRPYLK